MLRNWVGQSKSFHIFLWGTWVSNHKLCLQKIVSKASMLQSQRYHRKSLLWNLQGFTSRNVAAYISVSHLNKYSHRTMTEADFEEGKVCRSDVTTGEYTLHFSQLTLASARIFMCNKQSLCLNLGVHLSQRGKEMACVTSTDAMALSSTSPSRNAQYADNLETSVLLLSKRQVPLQNTFDPNTNKLNL